MKFKIVIALLIAALLLVSAASAARPVYTMSGYSDGKPFITFIYPSAIPNPTGYCKVNYITGVPTNVPNNATIGDNTVTNVPRVTSFTLPYKTV